ncbi:hypothetical protein CEXT_254001 [Caerostris extrusa]|uniref:Uncharacterized protein n=1 Tax=Caerostris extrusa TaxID=172846 RepID=A0AAV4NGY3_CAEEX|nr:hypothetical protein CEXT_254001 [Caerostris extrusa]
MDCHGQSASPLHLLALLPHEPSPLGTPSTQSVSAVESNIHDELSCTNICKRNSSFLRGMSQWRVRRHASTPPPAPLSQPFRDGRGKKGYRGRVGWEGAPVPGMGGALSFKDFCWLNE